MVLPILRKVTRKITPVNMQKEPKVELRNRDETIMNQIIETADVVLHEPTGEKWVVAYVRGDRLAWCGWPEGEAKLSDCALVEKATPEAREKLLHELASINGSDSRKVMAQYILAKPAAHGGSGEL